MPLLNPAALSGQPSGLHLFGGGSSVTPPTPPTPPAVNIPALLVIAAGNTPWPIYTLGQSVPITAIFKDFAGNFVDPTQCLIEALAPDGTVISLTVAKDSTGNYHANLLVFAPGIWHYRAAGNGAATATEEQAFRVLATAFAPDVFDGSGAVLTAPGYDLGNVQITAYELGGYNQGG